MAKGKAGGRTEGGERGMGRGETVDSGHSDHISGPPQESRALLISRSRLREPGDRGRGRGGRECGRGEEKGRKERPQGESRGKVRARRAL